MFGNQPDEDQQGRDQFFKVSQVPEPGSALSSEGQIATSNIGEMVAAL